VTLRPVAALALVLAALGACDRERVELASASPEGVDPGVLGDPIPSDDGGLEADVGSVFAEAAVDPFCGYSPPVSHCAPCPKGNKIVDGEAICECCE